MKFVAVTSCPTGIAHTYMAAEALEQAAVDSGDEMAVETQGSAGSEPLSPETIAAADAVIFAADVEVRDRERFAGKPLVESGVKRAISSAKEMIDEAKEAVRTGPPATVATDGAGAGAAPAPATKVTEKAGLGSRLRQWLMTGVSYVIPFVAAGGLLIALSFALGGYQITNAPPVTQHFDWGSQQSWAALMFQIGKVAFGFLVPILAGFIAFAMADRPALVPGIVGGYIATQVPSPDAPAGFLGGLAAGLLAGAVVMLIKRWKVPRAVAGIMPVVVIPLISTFIVGVLMFVVLGPPLGALTTGLTNWLNGLSGANKILLGILLGLMMAFDMGGPINKTAYAFAVTGLTIATTTNLEIMAAVMAAGMTPPLGLALATVLRKNLFTHVEQENGKAAWVLGASFITEGAIPFAAGDPLRVIPSLMFGSAVTGALVMWFGNTLRAPHGGIFVVPLIGRPLLYLLAIAIGSVVTAVSVIVLKSFHRRPAAVETPATAAAAAGN
ncbi:PTS fructose transporter subunit IIC [Pseudonocardia acidicola]|uniref:PTS transporter subunit EIIC n=1 Tax=Pseudonocardia acidicola TaxID=2724939 RepID=A0ABX1S829_9PSEU|nr:fructose-specific PTS transporter subunit EIIC [Pseudonocardia acidicola]NMH97719.1 PTS transporter subunit EIIC [Pseudonocardia acidicola]